MYKAATQILFKRLSWLVVVKPIHFQYFPILGQKIKKSWTRKWRKEREDIRITRFRCSVAFVIRRRDKRVLFETLWRRREKQSTVNHISRSFIYGTCLVSKIVIIETCECFPDILFAVATEAMEALIGRRNGAGTGKPRGNAPIA